MSDRTRSDAFLAAIGLRKLTEEEYRAYISICLEEGSLDAGEGLRKAILEMRKSKPPEPPSGE